MRKIVIDTNIVFSAFLNINSRIGQILINGSKYYDFFAPDYIRTELSEHKGEIIKIGKLNEDRYLELYVLIMRKIRILNHLIIPKSFYQKAYVLCKDIDIDDAPFIAINNYVRGQLWTGDRTLRDKLSVKGYKRFITTADLYIDFIERENKK